MIVLDTHAWIWWIAESDRLSAKALKAIEQADVLGVSIMSCWETAMLVAKRRIVFKTDVREWIEQALVRPKVRLLPLDPVTAVSATLLPDSAPADPVDRLIIAECRRHGISLVTRDEKIAACRLVDVVW